MSKPFPSRDGRIGVSASSCYGQSLPDSRYGLHSKLIQGHPNWYSCIKSDSLEGDDGGPWIEFEICALAISAYYLEQMHTKYVILLILWRKRSGRFALIIWMRRRRHEQSRQPLKCPYSVWLFSFYIIVIIDIVFRLSLFMSCELLIMR